MITCDNKYIEKLQGNKFETLDEVHKFLEKYKLPQIAQE